MRFTIRDLLWLTVVVALGVAWGLDRWHLSAGVRDAALWREVALRNEQRVIQLEREASSAHVPSSDLGLQSRLEEFLRDLPPRPPNPLAPSQNQTKK